MTSTGVPFSRAGANCHCRTACDRALDQTRPSRCRTRTSPTVSVAPHDDLEHHFAGDVGAARFVGVVRTHLLKQPRRRRHRSQADTGRRRSRRLRRARCPSRCLRRCLCPSLCPFRLHSRALAGRRLLWALPSAAPPDSAVGRDRRHRRHHRRQRFRLERRRRRLRLGRLAAGPAAEAAARESGCSPSAVPGAEPLAEAFGIFIPPPPPPPPGPGWRDKPVARAGSQAR